MTKRKPKNVLTISDLHIPYEHPDALKFCLDLKKEHDCSEIVFMGDIFDFAGFSLHTKNPDSVSSGDEIRLVLDKVKPWIKAFPKAKVCWGNHELRLFKRMKEAGIPSKMFPSINTVLGLPLTWDWAFHHEIDNVRYMHGSRSGLYVHAQYAKDYMQSVVHAHTHSSGAVQYMSTDNVLVYGMNVGCLIDTHSYAFEYARDFTKRPVIGTGVVLNRGTLPLFVPMSL